MLLRMPGKLRGVRLDYVLALESPGIAAIATYTACCRNHSGFRHTNGVGGSDYARLEARTSDSTATAASIAHDGSPFEQHAHQGAHAD